MNLNEFEVYFIIVVGILGILTLFALFLYTIKDRKTNTFIQGLLWISKKLIGLCIIIAITMALIGYKFGLFDILLQMVKNYL